MIDDKIGKLHKIFFRLEKKRFNFQGKLKLDILVWYANVSQKFHLVVVDAHSISWSNLKYCRFFLYIFIIQIAGARIIAIHRRENYTTVPREMHSAEMKKIWPFLHQLDEDSNIFKFYPDLDCYADIFMASVDRRYRGQGLATEMYESAVPFLKARGIRLVKSCFTSPFTQKNWGKSRFSGTRKKALSGLSRWKWGSCISKRWGKWWSSCWSSRALIYP